MKKSWCQIRTKYIINKLEKPGTAKHILRAMTDTNDSWLQSGGQQAWLSLKKNGGRSAKI